MALLFFELQTYAYAEIYLRDLKRRHEIEIQRLYDDIHPTRTQYDRDTHKWYSESINVAEYAIWIIETRERQAKELEPYKKRKAVFDKVLLQLSQEERKIFRGYYYEGLEIPQEVAHPVYVKIAKLLQIELHSAA